MQMPRQGEASKKFLACGGQGKSGRVEMGVGHLWKEKRKEASCDEGHEQFNQVPRCPGAEGTCRRSPSPRGDVRVSACLPCPASGGERPAGGVALAQLWQQVQLGRTWDRQLCSLHRELVVHFPDP